MDFNKLKDSAMGFMHSQQQGSGSNSQQGSTEQNMNNNNVSGGATGTTGQNTNTGGEDYGDKGLDFLEKKTGHTMSRDQNEKITDGARGMFEKMTGKHIDSKYSN